ncbi:hypothetical protein D3C75_992320 [compost metagenome]
MRSRHQQRHAQYQIAQYLPGTAGKQAEKHHADHGQRRHRAQRQADPGNTGGVPHAIAPPPQVADAEPQPGQQPDHPRQRPQQQHCAFVAAHQAVAGQEGVDAEAGDAATGHQCRQPQQQALGDVQALVQALIHAFESPCRSLASSARSQPQQHASRDQQRRPHQQQTEAFAAMGDAQPQPYTQQRQRSQHAKQQRAPLHPAAGA